MAALAVQADVEAILCRVVPTGDVTFVSRLLDMASARVRRFTRQTLSAVTADVLTVPGTWGTELHLPQIPVTAVTSITVDGVLVDPTEYTWTRSGLITRYWRWWGGPKSSIVVTYNHGFATIPDDIVTIVAALVAEQYRNPDQLQQERAGSYEVTYAGLRRDVKTSTIEIGDDQKDALQNYRIRQVQTTIDAPIHREVQQIP
jgi:hypothetical protein